jgi:hypothetical protein
MPWEKRGRGGRHGNTLGGALIAGTLAAGAMLAVPASAAANPANDDFANAQVLNNALPVTASGTNVGATAEPNEPNGDLGPPSESVWYRWTPLASGQMIINTCAADHRMRWAIYTGSSLGSLSIVAATAQGFPCELQGINFTAGTTYDISVDTRTEAGAFTLSLYPPGNPPPNDNFANALALGPSLPLSFGGSNGDATAESGEPHHGSDPAQASVWFTWTAPTSGFAKLDVCESDNPTAKHFAVYTGSVLNSLTRRVDSSSGGCSRTFPVSAGTNYKIAVDSNGAIAGGLRLSMRIANPPPNDAFANAEVVSGGMGASASGTNVDATAETGEPTTAATTARKSVWYEWTAPSDFFSEPDISACDSSFSTRVGVFTGDTLAGLTPVQPEDGTTSCNLLFFAIPGQTYRIVVDGSFEVPPTISDEGTIQLQVGGFIAPFNDDFADAQPLASILPVSVDGFTIGATDEPGEPSHAGVEPFFSVWYSWSAPSSGPISIDTCDSDFDSLLAVYAGNMVSALTPVAANDDGSDCVASGNEFGSSVALNVTAGSVYRIAVDGYDAGTFALAIRPTGPHTVPSPPVLPRPKKSKCRRAKKHHHSRCKKKRKKRRSQPS